MNYAQQLKDKILKKFTKKTVSNDLQKMATSPSSPSITENECALKQCLKRSPINSMESRVEVKSFEPKSKSQTMLVNWKEGGAANFHYSCWDALLKSAADAYRPSQFHLSDLERTMILEARKTAELFDSHAKICGNAAHIAEILKVSHNCIAFTGAGISTAAGIGDFRGKDGKWTNQDKKKNFGSDSGQNTSRRLNLSELRPTYTHEALCKLLEMGLLKFIISQNTDGLHCLSGVPPEKLAELHGNSFVEKCEKCQTSYERTFGVRRRLSENCPPRPCLQCKLDHRTGRKCSQTGCDGCLMNTIINFGDHLESRVLKKAEVEAEKADAVLILGSTLMVSPAHYLVTKGPEPHRLIICNRQVTHYDEVCTRIGPDGEQLGSRVFGDCDNLMKELMKKILPAEELCRWEAGRTQRMKEYNKMRAA
ncbi:unnamed protein product [Lymnaea stagnalis]|uniref:Deacetylase sirtuin-type domain-containing protein n=1 Tax=Lymnaea stagnalis TaxID=6523 RepID=A0AAV2I6X2_LYMST